MKKRICGLSRLTCVPVSRCQRRWLAGWLLCVSLGVAIGCGDNSAGVPAEEEGLIEFPVEEGEGQGTQEFTSERKAE